MSSDVTSPQSSPTPTLIRTRDFVDSAVALICEAGREAIDSRGFFRLGLAGGSTPKAIYEALAAQPNPFSWEKVIITFGDERCVPPDDAASNYRMACESLLSRVSIPSAQVLRIRGEIPAAQAAAECESQLADIAKRMGEAVYSHDLLLLGLGEDGHTASLFPGSPALEERERTVIPAFGPKPPPQRVSFTFPLINASRHIVFLLNDPAKEPVLQEVLSGQHPAARVCPNNGRVTWVIGER
ncbi:MAG: 6-phosphogluconolactonase [Verrucomicrobiota bacterium]